MVLEQKLVIRPKKTLQHLEEVQGCPDFHHGTSLFAQRKRKSLSQKVGEDRQSRSKVGEEI